MKLPKNKTIGFPLGILFVIIGIAGLFLPILQGILLILLGLALLGFPIEKYYKKYKSKLKK